MFKHVFLPHLSLESRAKTRGVHVNRRPWEEAERKAVKAGRREARELAAMASGMSAGRASDQLRGGGGRRRAGRGGGRHDDYDDDDEDYEDY